MSKVLFQYLLSNYFKTILKVLLIFYSFGLILNLFEEIEFFKNINTSLFLPLMLTSLIIPSLLIKYLPFVIFVSSMWFLLLLRNSKDLLTLKVFGYSNFKIFLTVGITSFLFGWFVLFTINPITSTMMKYYEQTKSRYSQDIDHLVSINKNGLWIKENSKSGYRIISADETRDNILKNITIFILDRNYNLEEKIYAKFGDIEKNEWILNEVTIENFDSNLSDEKLTKLLPTLSIYSEYNYEKINSLFKNFDTMSFLDLILNYQSLQKRGYDKSYLDQSLNSMLSLPFFLLIMTALSAILTMNTLKKSNNFTFIVVGIIACVAIYYFNNLSLALGQTNRISLSLSAWIPVVSIGLLSSIGILQINEK